MANGRGRQRHGPASAPGRGTPTYNQASQSTHQPTHCVLFRFIAKWYAARRRAITSLPARVGKLASEFPATTSRLLRISAGRIQSVPTRTTGVFSFRPELGSLNKRMPLLGLHPRGQIASARDIWEKRGAAVRRRHHRHPMGNSGGCEPLTVVARKRLSSRATRGAY